MGADKLRMPTLGDDDDDKKIISEETFGDWTFKLEAYAHKKQWTALIELAEKGRSGEAVEVGPALKDVNADLFYDLALSTKGSAGKLLQSKEMRGDGVKALNALYAKYCPTDLSSRMQVFADLADEKIKPDETDVENYAARIDACIEKIGAMAKTKEELLDLMKRSNFLHGLRGRNEVFKTFTTAILIGKGEETFEELKTKAGEHLGRALREMKEKFDNHERDDVLNVNGRERMTPAEYKEYLKTVKCFKCNQMGHFKRDCKEKGGSNRGDRDRGGGSRGFTKRMLANMTTEDKESLMKALEEDDLAFATQLQDEELALVIKDKQLEADEFWIVDPASAVHLTNKLGDFDKNTFNSQTKSSLGGFAQGMDMDVYGAGNCPIEVITDNVRIGALPC